MNGGFGNKWYVIRYLKLIRQVEEIVLEKGRNVHFTNFKEVSQPSQNVEMSIVDTLLTILILEHSSVVSKEVDIAIF